ncbi:hypothetical protein SAMN06265370_1088 [Puniceibacterium sediminis]|uniref:Uncharacterized protein n=1 Tax=Puniceibacterium sediminis TaxID=1608407 RepID=A0A238WWR5_9RHOB|nr:hypothetical protein SAMN06265370_1088 [Puniceibacterium sediminis]
MTVSFTEESRTSWAPNFTLEIVSSNQVKAEQYFAWAINPSTWVVAIFGTSHTNLGTWGAVTSRQCRKLMRR